MSFFSFSKYQQGGNDFVIIDDRDNLFPVQNEKFIQTICHRKFGIGADGVILLQKSSSCDCLMRIFNSNGKEAESCGNGICCLGSFLKDNKIAKDHVKLELIDTFVEIFIMDRVIKVLMDRPRNFIVQQSLKIEKDSFIYHYVNTGVPHCVVFVDDLEKIEVKDLGLKFRCHDNFRPLGANVNFARIDNDQSIACRTYERGVEDETLSCGTGACAVALIASLVYDLSGPITVCHPGGELQVSFQKKSDSFDRVTLTGAPQKIFYGQLAINYGD